MVKFEILIQVYRSLEAKGNLLEELYVKYPDLSKKTLERFLKENTLKEKREGDPVAAYHLIAEQMALLPAQDQQTLADLNEVRMQPHREQMQREQAEREEREKQKQIEREEKEEQER